jgi:hypothetical protein
MKTEGDLSSSDREFIAKVRQVYPDVEIQFTEPLEGFHKDFVLWRRNQTPQANHTHFHVGELRTLVEEARLLEGVIAALKDA